MPTHSEKRFLPYTPEQMFQLVAQVERYPDFLPWCVGSRIRKRTSALIVADLMIGFKMVKECFTSTVLLIPPGRIEVTYAEGPFKYLRNYWVFEPADGGCMVDFYVDFEFNSKILQKIIEVLFSEAVQKMVGAFETRAHQLYAAPKPAAVGAARFRR